MEETTTINNPAENVTETPEAVNDSPENVPERLESENEIPESVPEAEETEQPETPPTSWENASGEEEHPEESKASEVEEQPLPEGQDLSLLLPAFDSIFDTADSSLRDMARAMKTKLIESGELNIKITLNNYGGVLVPDPKKCQVTCSLKPAKVATAIRFPSDLEIAVEQDGRVFISNGEHQMSFDDVPAGGALVTTDESGVVQDVKLDPCQETDCPFYDTECEYNCQGREEFEQCPGCVKDTVENWHCNDVNLLDVYNKLMEDKES